MGIFDWLRKKREQVDDANAAEMEYRGIFNARVKKTGAKVDPELNQIFLKGYFSPYNHFKKVLTESDTNYQNTGKEYYARQHTESISGLMNSSLQSLEQCPDPTSQKGTEYLGSALGGFLVAVEYGITSPAFLTSESPKILDKAKLISIQLKKLGKSISPKFISRRMIKIADKHAKHMTEDQIDLIAKLGALFK